MVMMMMIYDYGGGGEEKCCDDFAYSCQQLQPHSVYVLSASCFCLTRIILLRSSIGFADFNVFT